MTFFTHVIEGEIYGAWYRRISPVELEVIAAGLIRRAAHGGFDELAVARSVLETHVSSQRQDGAAVHPLGKLVPPLTSS